MNKYADLHIHTYHSDGTFGLTEIVSLAKKAGIDCISVTDHDSVAAYSSLPLDGLELIPGIELTSDINNTEVHILGYLIDYKEVWFERKLTDLRQARIGRMREMCSRLCGLGIAVNLKEVLDFAGNECVGRLHLARLLAGKRLVASIQEAFNKYIGNGCPAYVAQFRMSPQEAIELILKARGIPVLAHPYILRGQDMLIPELIKAGLMGLEAFYPEHSANQAKRYQALAKEYKLLVTGGSDCHGQAKSESAIGTVMIGYDLVEKLKSAKPK